SGTLEMADGEVVFSSALGNRKGSLSLRVAGKHNLESGEGSAQVTLAPLRFEPGGRSPRDIVPAFGGRIYGVTGGIDASGNFRWGPGVFETPLRLGMKSLSFEMVGLGVKGLRGDLQLRRSLPPEASPGQELKIERLNTLIAITMGRAVFGITGNRRVDIETIEGRTLGGVFTGSGWVEQKGENGSVRFRLEGIQVSDLTAAINLEGLTGSGQMSGTFPIDVHDGRAFVTGARLEGGGQGGWIRYRPGERPAAFPAENPQLAEVLAILEDFRYDSLVFSLDGPLLEELAVRIELKGFNPAHLKGQRVELNLSVTTHLYDLFRNATATTRISESLGRRLRKSGVSPAE
ncbi:MAG: YdbH domain-containing protein, partial [Deltaproteobacteria bacterium]|nr:YdbH domain-containing protein [Deltaproteobacteria bacterium]